MSHQFWAKSKSFTKYVISYLNSQVSLILCGLGVFSVILNGSYFQQLIASVLFPSRPTIMQTAAKGGLYIFPNLYDVVFSIYNLPLLFIGFLSVTPLKMGRLIIEQLILCSAILSIFITLYDIFLFPESESFTAYITTNFLFNFAGSLIIFILFFSFLGFINQNFGNNIDIIINIRISISIFCASILLSSTSFLTARFFLHPLDVDFSLSYSPRRVRGLAGVA